MVVLNFKASPELVEQLRARARHNDRSMAAEVRRALRAHLMTTETSEGPAGNGTLTTTSDSGAHHVEA